MRRGTAPPIQTRRVDETRPYGVKLNIPRRGEQIRLIEHERSKPPLPEVATPALPEVDHPRVSPMCFTNCPPQNVGRLWNRDQVDMIGHQAVGPEVDLLGPAELSHQIHVALVILVAEARLLPTASPLRNVMRQSRCIDSR